MSDYSWFSRTWFMEQDWTDLLFMNWPVPRDILLPLIPPSFTLDEYQGTAWISLIPFHVSNTRIKGCPVIPGFNAFDELNIRTYVTYEGIKGVYFLKINANHPLMARFVHTMFGLPYFSASIRSQQNGLSNRFVSRSSKGLDHFAVHYSVVSPPLQAEPGSLIYWLTERYCLWLTHDRMIYKGPIYHQSWKLQKARIDHHFYKSDLLPDAIFSKQPIAYYSDHQHAHSFPLTKQI
ncbi:YqjF family protein [Thalassobacillus sp. CUG 92003]|uniref:YqjF family protein n=1 Tax=Thalassobacillus sp. CUG 92003 TaxID=2736641 RepID=UPI0015E75E19|nr:DUF2071 domain-containing protein [Thalassobacillus sp. CUG 92003]